MKIIVNPHDIKIDETDVINEGEYHITQLNFEFSKEYTDDLVKKAIFIGNDNKAYEMIINNNTCNIPAEILIKQQSVFLGVYAYKITGEELILRYSPSPVIFPIIDGSYKADSVPSEEITPSQFEQYQQALQNGLAEVNAKLQEVINTSETLEENGTYAKEQGDYAKKTTDELVSKVENGDFNGATFTPSVDAEGNISWSNDKGLQNPDTQNIKGSQGKPFTIEKTYHSVEAMEDDFDNMEVGDYVMIASDISDEDNAKLYVKTETEWVFITDFSGAIGIQGEPGVGITTVTSGQSIQQDGNTVTPVTVNKTDGTQQTFEVSAKNGTNGIDGSDGVDGVTPNLQIGTVTTLEPNEQATVTRTGTDEEPLFNFGIPKGQQGEQGIQGIPGQDGQPGQDGADGKDATINGQNTVEITTDNNITLDQQESVLKLGLNNQLIPKQDAEGTDNTFDDGLESPLYALGGDGKSEQVVTTGKQLFDCELELGTISLTGVPTQSNTSLRSKNFQNVTANTQYTISCNSTNSIALRFYQEDETFISSGTTQQSPSTFTTPENCTKFKFVIVDNNNLFLETMLNLGSSVLPYEPYSNGIPSPSPDYEQPINSIEGSLEFACKGKNLLPYPFEETTKTENGITFTDNGDGTITVNGTATAGTYFRVFATQTNQEEIPGNYISGSVTGCNVVVAHREDSKYTSLGVSADGNSSLINKGLYDIGYIELSISQGTTLNNVIIKPMLSNEQNVDWEPYIEPNEVTFDLGQEKLRSVGDVKDELVVDLDTGDYYKVENVREVVLDGSSDERWEKGTTNTPDKPRFFWNYVTDGLIPTSNDVDNILLTNLFKSVSAIQTYKCVAGISIDTGGRGQIYNDKFINYSLDDFKNWLSTNNVIMDYQLKESTTIKLGTLSAEDLPKLKTFKGYNNVTVNTNLGLMNIRFTYGLDIKKYIDNKLAEISSALIEEE